MPRFVDLPQDYGLVTPRHSEPVISKHGFKVGEDDLAPVTGIAIALCAEAVVVLFAFVVWTLWLVALS